MHIFPLIRDLAIILGVAGIVSLLFHRIRQPVVLGYIIAGAIVGPYTPPFPLVTDIHGIKIWAEIGVIFLMFSLGLEFSFRKLVAVGVPAGITAGVEVIFMLGLGYLTGHAFGWKEMDCLFLGAMLSISSTTIIIKALDELKLKTHRFAEMIFAILIVEDLIAILILVALSTIAATQTISGLALLNTAAELVLVVGSWFLAGYFLVPRLVRYVGRFGTHEMLTLISLSLCLALSVFAAYFNYSVALGAFIMGSILAESTESHKIVVLLEPLRDLFAAVFFVSVGMLINPIILWKHLGTVLIISLVTIVGKVFSTTLGSLLTGQPLKRSVQVGFGLAQIGEFSFIIANLGLATGTISEYLYPIGVAVSILTTFTTPYLIKSSERVADHLERRLPTKLKVALTQYGRWIEAKHNDAAEKKDSFRLLAKWFINGIIVSVLFILSSEYSLPVFKEKFSASTWSVAASWLLTVLVSAPFIWAMLSSLSKSKKAKEARGITPESLIVMFLRFVTLIWLGVLSRAFWPLKTTIFLIVGLELVFFVVIYRQIERYYRWYEEQFLSTFQIKEDSISRTEASELRHLAPWDAHLVKLRVHPNAAYSSKTLLESKLRDRYGINVVIIQRGDRVIVAPRSGEKLFPQDVLLVLGTDEQIDQVRPLIEIPEAGGESRKHINEYEMRQIRLTPQSPLDGLTIRESGIRENFDAMVVGIERAQKRTINPDSNLTLQTGDILWVVGDRDRLSMLAQDTI